MSANSDCSAVLQLGRAVKIEEKSKYALLYDNQIGIEKKWKEMGGTGKFVVDGLPLGGSFFGKSSTDVYQQYESLNFQRFDSYVFQTELGDEVAGKWLECMKLRHRDAWMTFGKQEDMLLKFGYGDSDTKEADVVSVQTTTGLDLKGVFPKKLNGERSLAVGRKPGTNRAEGVRVELLLDSKNRVALEAVLPPNIPTPVHWKSEEARTSVPGASRNIWKWDIPEIPEGLDAVLYCYYVGGSPADRAAVTLTATVRVIDEATGKDVGDGFRWKALGPQTHIAPSSSSMSLPSGKYRTEVQLATEENGPHRGAAFLQMMILVKLNEDDFKTLDWNPLPN